MSYAKVSIGVDDSINGLTFGLNFNCFKFVIFSILCESF